MRQEKIFVRLDQPQVRKEFIARKGPQDRGHIRNLTDPIRNNGALRPLLHWCDPYEREEVFPVLDGLHRLAAYKSVDWSDGVPTNLVHCDRRTTLLLAASANSKDMLPLTYVEKADLAWRLVRELGMSFSKREFAKAIAVSARTVANMRSRWKTLENTDVEITG